MQKKVYINFTLFFVLVFSILYSSMPFFITKNDGSIIQLTKIPKLSWEIPWNENGNLVCGEEANQGDIQICSDGSGGSIITWDQWHASTGIDVYVQRINSTGEIQWGINGTLLYSNSENQWQPHICSDGMGGAIITWKDFRNAVDGNIYAQRISSNGVIQWNPNGVEICTESNDQNDPRICSDGAGGAIIIWTDNRPASGTDIYAQRIDTNGDVLWTVDGVPLGSDTYTNRYAEICSDGLGGAIVAWETQITGANIDVYAQRVDSDGVRQWGANGKAISTEDYYQQDIAIVNNEKGGAIITWEDHRTYVDYDIYAQRVSQSGLLEWTTDGVPICTASEHSWDPDMTSDNAGGAIVVWKDFRGGYSDIYAQRINSDGVVQWETNGKIVCNATLNQEEQRICSDGGEGAIITWQDEQGIGGDDIYAQRINSNGESKWTSNGIALSNITGTQEKPLITSVDTDSAIVAWIDNRAGDLNIYAQKISNSPPTSNHPADIATFTDGLETINWVLSDDCGGGKYRVRATDVNGSYNDVIGWTAWTPIASINVNINRDYLGTFNYVLEFYDDQNRYGSSDTVIVQVVRENLPPISTHPEDINTTTDGIEMINWTLTDDGGGGMYRVLANDSTGDIYTVVNWTAWINNTLIQVPINRTDEGVFNYTIEYYDNEDLYGIPDTVIVIVSKSRFRISGYYVPLILVSSFSLIYVLITRLKRNLNRRV